MKKTLICILAAAALCGCRSPKVKISGRFVGTRTKTVYLEQATPQRLVDSAVLDASGDYRIILREAASAPELYNLICDNERIPLLLGGGDRVEVNAMGSIIRNYTVEGSAESALLREFYQSYAEGIRRLDHLAGAYARSSEASKTQAKQAYTDEYRRIKREQLRFIVQNKSSLAAVYALYQRLPGDPYLFNDESDVIYFRTVAEALRESYPESSLREALESDVEKMEARQTLLSSVRETTFPELEINDMYGKKIRLSDLRGKVILVDFWSAELGNSNALNAELKELYARYAAKGFEVYQVAVDRSKPLWINAVQEQGLPWISVSELQGQNSLACRLYNVGKLPANFLIDRQGIIVGQDLYGSSLERKLNELL